MEYQVIDKTSYKLHFIKTNRFRTITFRIGIKQELDKKDITKRNILADLLIYSTKEYNTRKKMVEKLQDLYSAQLYSRTFRNGNYNSININLTILNEKYTEKGMLEESIKMLSSVLFNPNIENNSFEEESFKFIKKSNELSIKTIKENPSRYSCIRLLEEMDPDAPYSTREFGYIDELETITKENIIDYYNKVINNSIVDIYVIGNFDSDEMEKYLDKYIKFKNSNSQNKNIIIEHEKFRESTKIEKEEINNSQSKLTIGCKISKLTDKERNYVLSLYNIILGSSPESKLFKNVREKYSLCYHISSSLNKLDNLLLIRSGINKNNFEKVFDLIKKEMKDMENGNFSEQSIENAKNIYITRLNEILDDQDAIIDTYTAVDALKMGDIEQRKKDILTVTKEEIVNISKKINIDTVFLLEGVKEDE